MLSAVVSFAILLVVYVIGALMPLLFWKLPKFREVRATQERLRDQALNVQFNAKAWEFSSSNQDAARASLFVHSNTTEAWIEAQVDSLSDLLLLTCVLQAIGVLYALSDGDAGGRFHLLLHAPAPEIGVLLVMAYLLHKMGKHWGRAKREFRVDAWS